MRNKTKAPTPKMENPVPHTAPTNPQTIEAPRGTVLPGLTAEDLRRMQIALEERRWSIGQPLYAAGERATSVYVIATGTVKLVRTASNGRQRIVRLLRGGDVAGIEALASDAYDNDAVTMSEARIYRLPASALHALSTRSQDVHTGLMHKWHQALKGADDWLADFNVGPAGSRVRQFVLRMRHAADPSLTTLFSREDMGAMLGLNLETVSRELTALVRAGLIQRHDSLGRTYRIIDATRLAVAAA